MPGADDGVEARVFELDEVEKGHVSGPRERTRCEGPRERDEREKDGDHEPPAEQAVGCFGDGGGVVHEKVRRPAGGPPQRRGVADDDAPECERGAGRRRVVPDAEHGVGERVFEGDEVEDRNVAGCGEPAVAEREVERGESRGDGAEEVRRAGSSRCATRAGTPVPSSAPEFAFPQGSIAPEARAGSDPEVGRRGGKSRPFPGRPSRRWRGVAPSPILRANAENGGEDALPAGQRGQALWSATVHPGSGKSSGKRGVLSFCRELPTPKPAQRAHKAA